MARIQQLQSIPIGMYPSVTSEVLAIFGHDGENDTVALTIIPKPMPDMASAIDTSEDVIFEGVQKRIPAALTELQQFAALHGLDFEALHAAVCRANEARTPMVAAG